MSTAEIDLNPSSIRRHAFSRTIEERVDAVVSLEERKAAVDAIVAEIEANPPEREERWGRSVSASAIGDDCARRVQLNIWPTFHPDAPIPRKRPLDAKSKAIFERGHQTEVLVANWLQQAQFDLLTHTPTNTQFGFRVASGQIAGYADGVIRSLLPAEHALWENKTISAKNWRAVHKHGVLKQYSKYDAQVQMLMAYLEMAATLFSFLNAETGELYFELMLFDPARAQAVSDRAVRILQATRAGDLMPKAASDAGQFVCRFCDFKDECWGE